MIKLSYMIQDINHLQYPESPLYLKFLWISSQLQPPSAAEEKHCRHFGRDYFGLVKTSNSQNDSLKWQNP